MNISLAVKRCSVAVLLALGTASAWNQPSQAQSTTRYFCGTSDRVPTTMYQYDTDPPVPLIRWVYNGFIPSGWTPQKRCEDVATRFQRFDRERALEYITTGTANNLPVVCAVRNEGDICTSDRVLFTLPPGRDPNLAVQEIMNIAGVFENGDARSIRDGRIYIDVDRLLIRNRQLYNR